PRRSSDLTRRCGRSSAPATATFRSCCPSSGSSCCGARGPAAPSGGAARLVAVYRVLFDLVLRRLDPERAHELAFGLIASVGRVPGLAHVLTKVFSAPAEIGRAHL